MVSFLELIVWILVNFGISNGIAHSSLFYKIRTWSYNKWKTTFLYCVMCLGFWSGLFTSLVWFSPTGTWWADPFLSSAACWLIYLGIMDRQAKT